MKITQITEIINPSAKGMYDLFIEPKEGLASLRDSLGLRKDWHEPDESEVSVSLVNPSYRWDLKTKTESPMELREIPVSQFDNACGGKYEAHLLIRKEGKAVARINLADLLALACEASK